AVAPVRSTGCSSASTMRATRAGHDWPVLYRRDRLSPLMGHLLAPRLSACPPPASIVADQSRHHPDSPYQAPAAAATRPTRGAAHRRRQVAARVARRAAVPRPARGWRVVA